MTNIKIGLDDKERIRLLQKSLFSAVMQVKQLEAELKKEKEKKR